MGGGGGGGGGGEKGEGWSRGSNINFVGLGRVVRDSTGMVVAAWALQRELRWSVEIAEAVAMKEGLRVVEQLGLCLSIVESDSSTLRELNGEYPFSPLAPFLSEIEELLQSVGGDSYYAI